MDAIPENIELPSLPSTDQTCIDIDLDIDDNRSVTSNVNTITVNNNQAEEDRLLELVEKLLDRGFSRGVILLMISGGLVISSFSAGLGATTGILNFIF